MKTRLLVFFGLLLCVFSIRAQPLYDELDSIVRVYTLGLKAKGIKSIGWRKSHCESMIGVNCKNGYTVTRIFVFWKDKNLIRLKKFDNCGSYKPIVIDDTTFFPYYEKYGVTIKKEEVKPFEFYDIKGNDTVISSLSTDHYCVSTLEFQYDTDSLLKSFNRFYTEYELYHREVNINGVYNNNLKLVIWDKQIATFVNGLEKKKKFRRTKGKHKFS